jgi:mannonate dehydratase
MEDRRKFIKQGAILATTLSIGGVSSALSAGVRQMENVKNSNSFSMAKDAGMEMSNAYFGGIENHKYLIELAKQMDVLGAVGGVDMRLVKASDKKSWDFEAISTVRKAWKDLGLNYNVVEGPPSLGDKTKLGLEGRDEEIENFITFMKNLKRAGVDVICYNWMPVVNWFRTDMAMPGRGGALMTAFDYEKIKDAPITKYGIITKETLWETLAYFLKVVVPEAEQIGMKLAMHPDDPQVDSIKGISRIMTSAENFERMMNIVPSDYNGVCFCQGNFSLMGVDIPTLVRKWGKSKIHFVHFRNVKDLSGQVPSMKFTECFHDEGQIDMYEAMKAYYDIGFTGPIRPDHVPTMAGELNAHPGYMNLGNLFAVGYIRGLAESVSKEKSK